MALTRLPLLRWARHLDAGTVRVVGHLPEPVRGEALAVAPGPVRVELVFRGGDPAEVGWARVAGVVCHAGEPLGEAPLREGPGLDEAVGLIDRLADVEVEARVAAREPVDVTLAEGVRLALDPDVAVTISGATRGAPGALRLSRPVVVGFGGEGVRIAHADLVRLSRLAGVRLSRLTLAPDGRVRLEGRASRGFGLAVQGGLSTASSRVTRLVRRGERFRSLRGYLHLD